MQSASSPLCRLIIIDDGIHGKIDAWELLVVVKLHVDVSPFECQKTFWFSVSSKIAVIYVVHCIRYFCFDESILSLMNLSLTETDLFSAQGSLEKKK